METGGSQFGEALGPREGYTLIDLAWFAFGRQQLDLVRRYRSQLYPFADTDRFLRSNLDALQAEIAKASAAP